jgi:hypothetical protein
MAIAAAFPTFLDLMSVPFKQGYGNSSKYYKKGRASSFSSKWDLRIPVAPDCHFE